MRLKEAGWTVNRSNARPGLIPSRSRMSVSFCLPRMTVAWARGSSKGLARRQSTTAGFGSRLKVISSLVSWAEAMPEAVKTANAASSPRTMLRAARPPQNFLLQLLFNSFSLFFHLDCAFAGSLEGPCSGLHRYTDGVRDALSLAANYWPPLEIS